MKKLLALLLVTVMALGLLTGCGGENSAENDVKDDGVIRVWVGEESAEFYQKVCDEYVNDDDEEDYDQVNFNYSRDGDQQDQEGEYLNEEENYEEEEEAYY